MLAFLRMDPKSYTDIVFFDGICNLCNGFVDFVVRRDPLALLKIAPLQGKTASLLLDPKQVQALASIVYLEEGKYWQESTAVLKILGKLGGLWRLAHLLRIVPSPIRDAVYRLVARNRYSWFGKKDTCRMPTPEERAHFLD